jgi:hypothetical protein
MDRPSRTGFLPISWAHSAIVLTRAMWDENVETMIAFLSSS